MIISKLLDKKETFSFEVFPPKTDMPLEPLLATIDKLYGFAPDFISCTYGAGGTNKGRNLEICRSIADSGHTPLAHFTCIGGGKAEISDIIGDYEKLGIENVLALRGDLPAGWEGTGGDFDHADGLIAYIHEKRPALCIGAAGYPEKHIQAASLAEDIGRLKLKKANGASFIMTQICHDADAFSRYLELLKRADAELPVIAGIMPILFREGTIRMTLSNGGSIPAELSEIIGKYDGDPESFKKAGKEYTAAQIKRFRAAGAAGIHIYTMNKYDDVADILPEAGFPLIKK
jgi:methylenetetrahydrofolate reductase (NADPH)